MGSHVTIGTDLPNWVPADALHYIAHTEKGAPIRALARQAGCHASTVLRQIRRVEMRRDDPLVDAALRRLGEAEGVSATPITRRQPAKARQPARIPQFPTDETLAREAARVLRRLCENGAVLAVAEGLDKAVVVRDGANGNHTRTAVVEASVAQAMALNDWIAPSYTGRITRYQITAAGRTALTEFLERLGLLPDQKGSMGPEQSQVPEGMVEDELVEEHSTNNRSRYAIAESPLSVLARRRDKNGNRFLENALVQCGERLREDFELAQMEGGLAQNWDHFLTAGTRPTGKPAERGNSTPSAARARVKSALADLGPGLSDVVLRCCCYLEGLESIEKKLGWSARSGKIVLRIALMRLQRHYEEEVGREGALIG